MSRPVDFLAGVHPGIVDDASESFRGPAPDPSDTGHDFVELRGTWTDGECDYFAIAQLRADGSVDHLHRALVPLGADKQSPSQVQTKLDCLRNVDPR